jgi:hypothetical protein
MNQAQAHSPIENIVKNRLREKKKKENKRVMNLMNRSPETTIFQC